MCQGTVGYVEQQVVGDASGYRLRATGPWMVMFGGSHFDTTLDLRALETNLGAKIGWRCAPVHSDASDGWETLGTERTTNASHPEAFDLSSKTSHLLIQGGVFTQLTTGAVAKSAWARLWTAVRGAGWLVARQKVVLFPSSTVVTLPIGEPFACAGVTKLMFAYRFIGVSGTIVAPTCVWRSFDTGDPRQPGAWSGSLATLSNVTADTSVNSGSLTVSTAGKLLAQPGVKFSTSGTDPGAQVEIVVAAKT